MKLFTIFLLLGFCIGCTSKTIPLTGTYTDGNFQGRSDKSKEQVWDNIIDFFSKNGISIKLIDKSSGLIVSSNTRMSWSQENSKGELVKKDAWVAVSRAISPGGKTQTPALSIIAEWNVRIKESEGKTLINVNLVNPQYSYAIGAVPTSFKRGEIQSTGVFENLIYNQVK